MGRRRTKHFDLPPRMRRRALKKGVLYYYDHGYRQGKRYWEPLGRDFAQAKQRWAEIEGGEPPSGSVSALLRHFQREALPSYHPSTKSLREAHMVRLEAVFGHMQIKDLRPHHIARYLRQHPYPIAANREIGTLSVVFSHAMEWGEADVNPCRGVRRNRETPRDRYVTDEEFRSVRAKAPKMIQLAMDLAYVTGMRRGDLLALRWDQVEDEGIRVRQEKTGRKQFIEWTDGLREVLEDARQFRQGETVICRADGKPYTTDGFSAMWQRVRKKAGADWTFHDIRAKCGTDAAAQNMDSRGLLGHTTEKQHQGYLRSKAPIRVTPLGRL